MGFFFLDYWKRCRDWSTIAWVLISRWKEFLEYQGDRSITVFALAWVLILYDRLIKNCLSIDTIRSFNQKSAWVLISLLRSIKKFLSIDTVHIAIDPKLLDYQTRWQMKLLEYWYRTIVQSFDQKLLEYQTRSIDRSKIAWVSNAINHSIKNCLSIDLVIVIEIAWLFIETPAAARVVQAIRVEYCYWNVLLCSCLSDCLVPRGALLFPLLATTLCASFSSLSTSIFVSRLCMLLLFLVLASGALRCML